MNISRTMAGFAATLCATGLALTAPAAAMADDTAAARDAMPPSSIVNGDFEYLSDRILSQATDTYNFANVDYVHGQASAPITRLETLTYRLNGGQGVIPNRQEGADQ